MNAWNSFWDKLPRWFTVAVWVGLSAFVTAIGNEIQNGHFVIRAEFVPIVNIVLVAVKDFINTQNKS